MFKTEDDVLGFFEHGGCMVDVENNIAYISDVNADGDFFGIMVADDIPNDVKWDVVEACQYALGCIPAPGSGAPNRMGFMEAPGGWFSEFCEDVLSENGAYRMEA